MELVTPGISVAVILLFITLIIASFGLILFILGLILKKPGKWVPGIILSVSSFILGIVCLVMFGTYFDRSSSPITIDNYSHEYNHPNNDDNYHATPDSSDKGAEVAEGNSSRVSGFIQDADKSLIYIKIHPAADLYDMGIKVTKIDTYNGSGKDKKVIPLEINFANKFKGNLQLILFSSDDAELGSSNVQINQDGNTTFTIKFVFDKTANFLQTDHARLKSSD
jgi:hypothetical protein